MNDLLISLSVLTASQIEELAANMTHRQIIVFRDNLKAAGNMHYLLRVLYYDYDKQCWI